MSEVILNFYFSGELIKIQCKRNEYMKDIFSSYCIKASKNINDIYFLYNGQLINQELKLEQYNKTDNEINILVYDNSNDKTQINKKQKQKQNLIICPKCRDICVININDYKISLNQCKNNHNNSNIILEEYFNEIQKLDESEIICSICKKKISEIYQNKFYICGKCNINLCPLCKSNHNNDHKIIDYESKYYICNIHGERYISFCTECNKNLCDMCELEHSKNHNLISHRDILPNNEIQNNLINLRKTIDKYKNSTQEIIKMINKTLDYLETYYNLSSDIINSYQKKNRNYQILKSLNNIDKSNQNIIKDLSIIINENKIDNKFKYIKIIYDKITNAIKNNSDNDIIEEVPINEKDYNLVSSKKNNIKEQFMIPPLIGLKNTGGPLYMNAILQCFCHIERFINFFKYRPKVIDIVKKIKII